MKANRRLTSREKLNLSGKLIIMKNSRQLEEDIEIVDISFDGVKIVFNNNDILGEYFSMLEEQEREIILSFNYDEKKYQFKLSIKWFRLYDIGERNFYVLTALNFKNRDEFKNELLELICCLQMRSFYI